MYGATSYTFFGESMNVTEMSFDNTLNIALAVSTGEQLTPDALLQVQKLAKNNTDHAGSLNAKYILCAYAASQAGFIEPMYFDNFPQPFMIDNDTIRQCILWAFALTLPCTTGLNEEKIRFLFNGLKDQTLGWCVSYIFRKFSEDQEYMQMICTNMWISILNLLSDTNLNEQIRTTIIYTMINIFKNRKEISEKIRQEFEKLVIGNDISKQILTTALNGLYTIVTTGSSLEKTTIDKLRELMVNEDSLVVERAHVIVDYLDDKRTLSSSVRYSFNSQVKNELTATQNTSVSRSEEECVEPTAKFLGLDNLLGKVGHLDRSFNTEIQPRDVQTGDHQAWYRTTYKEIENLGSIAKQGNLKDQDFTYLLSKMHDDSWHFTVGSRETIFQMIAEAFRDSAKAGQAIPREVIDHLICQLHETTKKLRSLNNAAYTEESKLEKILEIFQDPAGALKSMSWHLVEPILRQFRITKTRLSRTCSEFLLIVVRNQHSINDEQMKKIKETLEKTEDTQIKRNLIEIIALKVSKGQHADFDLSSIEDNLLDKSVGVEVSFLFFKAATTEKRVFSDKQMSILCTVGRSTDYKKEARENCLWALAYSIKTMSNTDSIPSELIDNLAEIFVDPLDSIRHAAAITVCNYINDSNDHFSPMVIERLAVILCDQDYGLLNNVLSIYLKLAKQKYDIPSIALNNISRFFQDDTEFDLREKSIWILKYAVENGQDLNFVVLDSIDHCLTDREFRIRNTAANVFIRYWNRKIHENECMMDRRFANRMNNLLLFFRNDFDRDVQKSALELIKNLVENNYKLPEVLFELIEYCLYDHDASIATNAVAIIASYSKRNSLRKQTIACLEYVLTIDTPIHPNVISILKTIVCQGHNLSEKSIVLLGQLLFKSIDPNDIIILLTHADRHQPLPKNVNSLVQQHYFVQVLRNSSCSPSLDKAYQGLVSFTDNGMQLSSYVLHSIFSLLKIQTRLLRIVVNSTLNGQHLNNQYITLLSDMFSTSADQSLIDLIRIFTNLIRQNHEIPFTIIDSLEKFITDSSVNIYVIEIYQLLIERHKTVDQSIVQKILDLLNPIEFAKKDIKFSSRLVSFFKTVAENRPNEVDQTYFPSLLQLHQSTAIRKDACIASKALAEHKIILESETLTVLINLLNYDNDIEIQDLALQTLEFAHSNNQITHDIVIQLLDLIHDQNMDDNENCLMKLKAAAQAGLKLSDRHFTKLCHLLFSCDLNLKREAAMIIALIASNGQTPSNKILQAVYGTLLDETINHDTIQLLTKTQSTLPSSVIDDLLYLVLYSNKIPVKEFARQILDNHQTNKKVMNFKVMLSMNKLLSILNENNSVTEMIDSKDDHQVHTALKILQTMLIIHNRIPIELLRCVASHIASHGDMVLDLLIVALDKGVKFDQSICKVIEDTIQNCRSSKIVILLQFLAGKQFLLQLKTLTVLFSFVNDPTLDDSTRNNAFIALEYSAQYQELPCPILSYFIDQLSGESDDIARRSFDVVRQQLLKSYVKNPVELLKNVRIPKEIDYQKLSQLQSMEQRLVTILTLLSVSYIDLNVFNLPVEQWSRELLCTNLLAEYPRKTSNEILAFYHHLTLFEQYKNYELYNDNRDTILLELIRKKRISYFDLSTINQIFIYLQTSSNTSIDILRSNDSSWLINIRKFFIEDKLETFLPDIKDSKTLIDHLIDQISPLDYLSADLIESLLRIMNQPTHILTFLDMIQTHRITNHELINLFSNDKYTIDRKSLMKQFEFIILNKTLLSKWKSPRERLNLVRINLRKMIEYGWTFTKMNTLINKVKKDDEVLESLDRFLHCLNILIDYQIDESIEQKLSEIFSTIESQFWLEEVHRLAIDRRFGSISSEKNRQMLLGEIQTVNKYDFSTQSIEMLEKIDRAFNSDSSVLPQGKLIKNWIKSDIQNWANNRSTKELSEMIAVIKRAIYLDSSFEPRLIQILSILIMLDTNNSHGRLLQILTGEGKSSIVSMLAVIKALQGKHVDIVTSSITLAKRDAHERVNFYSMFNLTVAHNNDEISYVKGLKTCYTKDIVYGTSSQFQFDILRDEFSLLGTRQDRRYDVVIIDEVDSMLIDENNTIARLADHLPGMEWLNSILFGIWQCVCANTDLLTNKNRIIRSFKDALNDSQFEMKIPNHLHRFVNESIPLWIEHAIRAKIEYKLDHHYMIKPDETRTKRIVPIDFSNTGVVQCSTTWSDGLHQFLQIKHGLKMTPLTVTTNFLSNTGFFMRYKKQIYGLTGTIGSDEAKDLLNRIYNVDTIIIPPFKQKRHFQLETILKTTDDDWLKSIVSTTVSHANNKQAVLIICETRLDAKAITKELQRAYPDGSVRLYTDNTDTTEANVVSNRIQCGEIIVATNLAGRGTDLKMSQEVENNGGLHVCLTFLPNNLRVEEQAIGRTSRQGNRGTSQMILSQNRTFIQLMSSYPEYLAGSTENPNDTIKFIRDWREKAESANIERIWKKEIPEIQKKDDLFKKFCDLLGRLRNQNDDSYRLMSVKERWGLWLKSMDQVVQNRRNLEQLIEEAKFRCIDVPRDGNSYLRVLSQHFQGTSNIDAIRNTIIEHMKKNKDLYKKNDDEDRHWATCRALNMNIVLFRSDIGGPYIYKRKDAKSTCFLGYETDTQYILLKSLNSDSGWEESYLAEIDTDDVAVPQQSTQSKLTEQEQKQLENLLLTKMIPLDLKVGFESFQKEICKQYLTNEIMENPCYLLLEADEIIAKLATWSNWIKSFGDSVLPIEKAKTVNDAINRLERAIKLDPTFAFSASANRAYLLVDKNQKSDTNYKITAKKYLLETQQQIERYILPQLLSMQVKSNAASDEFVFEDLAMQIETKIDILNHYHNHVKQAISVIESSQKLIDVHSKHEKTVNIGRKLYREEVKDYLEKHWNTIELVFHNLTVTEDMGFKTDQAIQILDLLPTNYEHVSMNYFDMNLEVIEQVTSKANVANVCLNIQYLNIDEVHDIIGDDRVTLSIAASSEQYQRAIENSKLNVILVEMDSQQQYLSADQALTYVKNEANNVKSISFECLNQTTVNTIVTGLEKIAISLNFTKIRIDRMKEVCQKRSKPYTVHLSNLPTSKAKICINETKERNFTMSLCDLKAKDARTILEKFDRNEQDINSSLKSIAEQYMKADQSHEELSAYRNMGVIQFIIMQELNPRPWISICVTAGLGVLQIAGGVCLAAVTCGIGVQLGIGLITEGISDIYYAVKGAISRNFSWKDYAIQKGISLALCFVTLGCSAISQAAKAAQTTAKGSVEFMKQTLRGTGTLIKNSARTLTTGAIKGTATTSFKLAFKQAAVVCVETGVRELANYSTDLAVQSILSPMKSVVGEEIERITNIEREKEYYDRVLCRALTIDAYYGNDNCRQKLEETAVKILTKEISAFVTIAKSLGSGISGAVIRHAQSFSKETSGNAYLKLGQQLLTVMPALKGCEEITKITSKFFDIFQQELTQLEQKMPTFDHFLRESDPSITQQTATEIRQLLERHHILNQNGTINIQSTDLEDAPDFSSHHSSAATKTNASPRNRNEKLMKSLNEVKFSDEKQKNLTIQVLNKYRAIDPRSFKAGKLQKKIIDTLTGQVMAIIQGAVVGPLANCFVGSTINALSQKIQLKLDSNGTIHDQLMQEGAQRYIANLSNDFYRDVQSGKIQLPPDTEKKLNDLIEKSKDPNFKPQNAVEELAVSIANNKQGGVIEIGILAAMTGKSISVIQSEQTGESSATDTDVTLDYSAPQTDKQGNFQDGHYESTDGNASNAGANDCLYASVIGKTSNTFKDTHDMRIKCAAFVLANPTYILSLQPAINIINGCSNPIRRKQLLMEGGQRRMTEEDRYRWEQERGLRALGELAWEILISDEIESARQESKRS